MEVRSDLWKALQRVMSIIANSEGETTKLLAERDTWAKRIGVVEVTTKEARIRAKTSAREALDLQACVVELTDTITKMDAAHRNHVKQAEELGTYYAFRTQLDLMKEHASGEHNKWDLKATQAAFDSMYPADRDSPGAELLALAREISSSTAEEGNVVRTP